ncbi:MULTISPECIES: DciA family protein [unclassified Methylophaga]|jgi:hypothetical protein|uniref:DUF721 domain-containing protein n=1 Tax=Pseudidiomarina aestuarii TaxID=624146 RepID=A0A2T4CYJ3_9GAMM|nr:MULTISPECIES: DciA family protein [unclassified Methylophaga]MAL50325.1 hypothetical protein [Methylophaga sp.]MBP26469.1 hypothetical protein [Methylophaga sp.]MDX1749657.1 DciA family protein [Methylophaga sp.]PTB86637.1 hypothetical protein C9940_01565 [Pseudidiomarina aestuarii]|tara:strand:- start:2021 stop:2473 length:453 start_codon:yes stop_codon:yes gene_type:complete
MSNKPLHFSTVCQANQQLQQISKRAQKLTQLNSILQEILPSQFAGHCQLANMKDNKIIIHTENAAIASLLRFHSATICKTFSSELSTQIERVEVKVKPQHPTEKSAKSNMIDMSNNNAALIAQTAAGLDDGQLKTALHKLAKRGKTRDNS